MVGNIHDDILTEDQKLKSGLYKKQSVKTYGNDINSLS